MWRRAYFFLILVRLYFALSPSYLHPDENFQGPEVIAGRVYSYPVHLTWEFTSEHPIRSAFPLWIVYGFPMGLLRWLWEGAGWGEVPPAVVYWTLRGMMFVFSFVLEDWAIQELASSPREQHVAVLLVASSYVTWTLQTHTFSNSIETLIVLWSLVLVGRIFADKKTSGIWASAILGFLSVGGTFTRITFPAFLLFPGLKLLPHFWRRPSSLLSFSLAAAFTLFLAIAVDTAFYSSEPFAFSDLRNRPTITPWNNLKYNSSVINLAQHGVHPYYQHLFANLPQLLGPALPLLIFSFRKTLRLASALTGIVLLSIFPHQEARFLLPAVPLLLSSLRLPKRFSRAWIATWIIFNVLLGTLMGVYHQGGVVPTQIFLGKQEHGAHAFWWKTYSPPIWLLDGKNDRMVTTDLMGMPREKMVDQLIQVAPCESTKVRSDNGTVYLVAPRSTTFLDRFKGLDSAEKLRLEELWTYKNHINLDDLDFGDDGFWPTLQRVVGRRGLTVWKAKKVCGTDGLP